MYTYKQNSTSTLQTKKRQLVNGLDENNFTELCTVENVLHSLKNVIKAEFSWVCMYWCNAAIGVCLE